MTDNMNYTVFKEYIKGKKVAIVGMGVSNLPLIKFFLKHGAFVMCCDRKPIEQFDKKTADTLKASVVELRLGEDYLDHFKGCDIILRSPGIRIDRPEFVKAQKDGAILTSEMELFLSMCPAKTIGVTGSDGKTTTTTLIYEILKKAGYTCFVGGNIGNPLLYRIEEIGEKDVVVVELSSFQLHNMRVSTDVAVITNISPNHLDYHKDYQEYIDAKSSIYAHQTDKNKLVVNYDNDITRKIGKNNTSSKTVFFSKDSIGDDNVYLYKDVIYLGDEPVIKVSDIKIRGIHNVENYMAAIGAVGDMVKREDVRDVAVNFGGVAHRMELVRELDGIKYYNDSIASSPTRTAAGLRACDRKVILIAGGYDKHIPFDGFGDVVVDCVKHLVVLGQTGPAIKETTEKALSERGLTLPITECKTFEEAVDTAHNAAAEGDYVILSPASASFDMFKNFEERGNLFKELVNKL